MAEILFLVHRIPYPPNKGDKIRSYHLLKHLAARYDVHLGCFADDRDEMRFVNNLQGLCKSFCVRPLNQLRATARSLKGLVGNEALTVPYYFDKSLAKWIAGLLDRNQISAVIAFSSPMGQYVTGHEFQSIRRIMDFVDIDSDKWLQYAAKSRIPKRWIFSREAGLLSDFEHYISEEFDHSVFVSTNEVEMYANRFPDLKNKLFAVCNGVDTSYFDSSYDLHSPFAVDSRPVVFTGMMNYWPNEDAMLWFAKEIWPTIHRTVPKSELWIVGALPSKRIRKLSSIPGVHVTGKVQDVRPYLKHASTVVAPLRIARGVQNKILEALAMGCSVVCTSMAAMGLNDRENAPLSRADTEQEFMDCVVENVMAVRVKDADVEARDYVVQNYDWSRNLSRFDELIHLPQPVIRRESHRDVTD